MEGFVDTDEVDTLWELLIGPRGTTDDHTWLTHLTRQGECLVHLAQRIGDERARIIEHWHQDGESYATIATRLGVTRGRVQQLVERGRALRYIREGKSSSEK
jgi:DNA-directed RNA polymerase specialized sigma24 family protein